MRFSDLQSFLNHSAVPGLPRGPEEMEVPILCYHRVVPDGAEDCIWTLGLAEFQGQIEWLASGGYQTISLRDLHRWQTQRARLPANPVVLTFDDGQEGFLERVAPILLEHNFRATLFLIAGMLDQKIHLTGGPPFRTLAAQEVTQLAEAGFDIQSHGLYHRDWTRLGAEQVHEEVAAAIPRLEELSGRPVQFVAYPYGRWTPRVRDLVEAAGILGACTTEPGTNPFHQDRFLLRRNVVLGRYAQRLLPWLRRQLRGIYRRVYRPSPSSPSVSFTGASPSTLPVKPPYGEVVREK